MMRKALLHPCLLLSTLLATVCLASIEGSHVELSNPGLIGPCDSVEFEVFVYNGSSDSEWVQSLTFVFPECFTVTDGRYDDFNAGWDFNFSSLGSTALFQDADGGHGEIRGDQGGYFYITVLIDCACDCGEQDLSWLLEGDGWGEEPHDLAGTLTFRLCETAVDGQSSWSKPPVKGT